MAVKLAAMNFGYGVTVTEPRSFAFGLDGLTHVFSEAGKGIVYGNFEVTGEVTIGSLPPGTLALDDLSDVTITSPATGHVLAYDGAGWVNLPLNAVAEEYDAGNSGTSKTINWLNGLQQTVAMTGGCTFSFTNPILGAPMVLILIQDATGSRVPTLPTNVKWKNGNTAPTYSTGPNKVDLVAMRYTAKKSGIYLADANIDVGAY